LVFARSRYRSPEKFLVTSRLEIYRKTAREAIVDRQNKRSAQSYWTWIVLLGMLIVLTSYIWIVYDPAWVAAGAVLASAGTLISLAGLFWRPRAPLQGDR
jgi:hypothetical protein